MLATYLKSLCYIHDQDNPFSIRQWIQQDQLQEWLFISSLGGRHESLKPLITAWPDIAILEKFFIFGIKSNRCIALTWQDAKSGQFQPVKSLDWNDGDCHTVYHIRNHHQCGKLVASINQSNIFIGGFDASSE
ncbi:MAG: type IV secretion system DNA-binding domain-containing protein [Proteobacteria bacterium]|nr:type IV secretion system DNA-binding domain-containing protein [Pseudomonadota bacterium]